MFEYDPAKNKYRLIVRYNGNELEYTLRQYHSSPQATYWHLISRSRVLDFLYDKQTGILQEELLDGQPATPEDFVKLIEAEVREISTN